MIVPVYPVRAPSGVFRKLDSYSIQDIGGGGGNQWNIQSRFLGIKSEDPVSPTPGRSVEITSENLWCKYIIRKHHY